MAYVGGKSKNADHIIDTLNHPKFDGMRYIEPFVGYAHILRRIINKSSYTAHDSNPLLIELLHGIQRNYKYPNITREQYNILKNKKEISFKRAIAGFTYSYNGKLWGGFTESSSSRTSYPLERKRYYDKLKMNKTFMKTSLSVSDYIKLKPRNALIYCDPPYIGTTGYGKSFDSHIFWDIMRKWSKNNTVFISEYTAPKDFKCIAKRAKHQSLNGSGAGKIVFEKLFTLRKEHA